MGLMMAQEMAALKDSQLVVPMGSKWAELMASK
jgi:hypothetical protein